MRVLFRPTEAEEQPAPRPSKRKNKRGGGGAAARHGGAGCSTAAATDEEEDDEEEEEESTAAAGAAAAASPPSTPPRAVECCVCLEARPLQELRLLAPCGHRCVCAPCAAGLLAAPHAQRKCPKCRVAIVYVTRVYDD